MVGLVVLLCCCVVLAVLAAAGSFGLALVTNLIPQGSQIQAARHTGYLYAANNRCGDWGLPLDGRDSASATRGWRETGKPSGWRFTTRRQRCDTQAAGAAERGSDAAAEGQSAPMMADLFWHSTQLLAAYAPTYTIRHASAHWMASSSVHSAKGHIDAVHRVRQPSHNKGRTSLRGQFLPTDRSSCEPTLTQQHVDKPNHEQAMPYRHRVSQSSHNGPLTSSISRFRPTEQSLCEPIPTNPHLQPPNPATPASRPVTV